jgi:CBS domain-containing protein
MVCSQIMKRGFEMEVVRPEDNLHMVARRMRDRGVGFLPVVDGVGRPIGTLTDRDLAVRAGADDKRPSAVTVREVMTTEPVTCGRFEELRKAEELMVRYKISRILCVDEAGMLAGIISLSDIIDAERDDRAAELLRQLDLREYRPTVV